jgi:uncharacterized membrane protein YraQ (UPF0718 family)
MPGGTRVDSQRFKKALEGLWNNFKTSMPILLGVLLLVGLANSLIPKSFFASLFTGKGLLDPFIGALFGSIAAGNPVTSYVIGGELLKSGVSLTAVLAFILSWVTVGIVQLPAESLMLGRRFALTRNAVSFLMAMLIALLTSATLELL